MANNRTIKDLSDKLSAGFAKARKKFIEQEKKNNGYLIISDKTAK